MPAFLQPQRSESDSQAFEAFFLTHPQLLSVVSTFGATGGAAEVGTWMTAGGAAGGSA
jgi:hypothetical protein